MIHERYTLFTRIPLFVGDDGTVWADDLWEKDLSEHLTYIERFRICCPVLPARDRPASARKVTGLAVDQVSALAQDRSWGSVLRNLVPNFRAVLRAVKSSDIVHSGGAGWAFPLSYYILALRPFLRFRWIMVIESSFWMKSEGRRPSPRQWLSHHFHGPLVRACVRAADAHIFTQAWYRDLFLDSGIPAHVAPAVWIDAGDILDAQADAATRPRRQGPARLIFPARLVPEKGVETVLEAIGFYASCHAADPAPRLAVDIIGQGILAERCRVFAQTGRPGVAVRFLDQVPYGAPFFELLRGYEALIVANRQPEQPRIVFDAFGQGVPCIATKTPGIETLVSEGETALLFDIDDAVALAELFERAVDEPETLDRMGVAALGAVGDWTHANMHRRREVFLRDRLALAP